jgi:cellobiose-specific phosphotransferase system component IIC
MTDRFYLRLTGLFIVLNIALIFFKARLLEAGTHHDVLLIGNLALALITALSYRLSSKAVTTDNNNAFVRNVYGATLAKMMLCVVGIVAYVLLNRDHVSKVTIFILMGLYVAYSFLETNSLSNKLRRKKS